MSTPAGEAQGQRRLIGPKLVLEMILLNISESARQKGKTVWIDSKLWNVMDTSYQRAILNRCEDKNVKLEVVDAESI